MATNRIGVSHKVALGSKSRNLTIPPSLDILDPGLLRPGRIDRKIEFPPPNPEARVTILRIHSRKVSTCGLVLLRLSS
jgi:ATP-dependent 26S proteasome regulatory subunit